MKKIQSRGVLYSLPTVLTFNMIKKLPEDVKKTIFTAHFNLWITDDVPTKLKTLGPKLKIDFGISTAENNNQY